MIAERFFHCRFRIDDCGTPLPLRIVDCGLMITPSAFLNPHSPFRNQLVFFLGPPFEKQTANSKQQTAKGKSKSSQFCSLLFALCPLFFKKIPQYRSGLLRNKKQTANRKKQISARFLPFSFCGLWFAYYSSCSLRMRLLKMLFSSVAS